MPKKGSLWRLDRVMPVFRPEVLNDIVWQNLPVRTQIEDLQTNGLNGRAALPYHVSRLPASPEDVSDRLQQRHHLPQWFLVPGLLIVEHGLHVQVRDAVEHAIMVQALHDVLRAPEP